MELNLHRVYLSCMFQDETQKEKKKKKKKKKEIGHIFSNEIKKNHGRIKTLFLLQNRVMSIIYM